MNNREQSFTGLLRSFVAGVFMVLVIAGALTWGIYFAVSTALAEQLKPRPLPQLYPNAQDVEEKVVPQGGDDISAKLNKRVVSFSTANSAEDVLAYYLDVLKQAGWEYWETTERTTGGLRKVDAFFGYVPDDGPTYRVNIRTTTSSSGTTAVKLEIFAVGSSWYGDPMTGRSP